MGQELCGRLGRVRALAGVFVLCSWARHPTFKVPLSGAYMGTGEEVLRRRLGDLYSGLQSFFSFAASLLTIAASLRKKKKPCGTQGRGSPMA